MHRQVGRRTVAAAPERGERDRRHVFFVLVLTERVVAGTLRRQTFIFGIYYYC